MTANIGYNRTKCHTGLKFGGLTDVWLRLRYQSMLFWRLFSVIIATVKVKSILIFGFGFFLLQFLIFAYFLFQLKHLNHSYNKTARRKCCTVTLIL